RQLSQLALTLPMSSDGWTTAYGVHEAPIIDNPARWDDLLTCWLTQCLPPGRMACVSAGLAGPALDGGGRGGRCPSSGARTATGGRRRHGSNPGAVEAGARDRLGRAAPIRGSAEEPPRRAMPLGATTCRAARGQPSRIAKADRAGSNSATRRFGSQRRAG